MKLSGPPRLVVFLSFLGFHLLAADDSDTVTPRWRRGDAVLTSRHHHHHGHHDHVHHWGPFFEEVQGATDAGLGIAVPLGGTVDLNCRVAMLHDKTVMWLRQSPDRVTLLTVGASLYSSDPRLAVKFQYPSNWKLHISAVQRADAGQYLCQVSTHPPRTLTTNLTVIAPELKVEDELGHSVHDRYYKTGSTIDLTCKVITLAHNDTVRWYKDGRLLDKVKIIKPSDQRDGVTSSRLVVPLATKSDSGTYACALSKQSSVLVHVTVLNGEYHAAVQHDTWASAAVSHCACALLVAAMTVFVPHC